MLQELRNLQKNNDGLVYQLENLKCENENRLRPEMSVRREPQAQCSLKLGIPNRTSKIGTRPAA